MIIGHVVNVLGIIVFIAEVALYITKRATGNQDIVTDSKSLRLIWRTIGISIGLTFLSRILFPHPLFAGRLFEYGSALVLVCGIVLRWISIIYLGREFTVNVAIIEGHRLVTDGPYRLIRHPSYSGLILIFLGLGLHSNNLVGLLALFFPVVLVINNRINIEEKAMEAFFGIEYRAYRKATKRLIPHVY